LNCCEHDCNQGRDCPARARGRFEDIGTQSRSGRQRKVMRHADETTESKRAIYDMPADSHKIEQGYYTGHVEGFGGTVDAR